MNKLYKINKYIYAFLLSIITILSLVLEYNVILEGEIIKTNNILVDIYIELYFSLKEFDVIYITLWGLIFYFYLQVYFNNKNTKKQLIISSVIAIILSIITTYLKINRSTIYYEPIFSNFVNVLKILLYLTGYYLIFNAIIRKITSINIMKNISKYVEKHKK